MGETEAEKGHPVESKPTRLCRNRQRLLNNYKRKDGPSPVNPGNWQIKTGDSSQGSSHGISAALFFPPAQSWLLCGSICRTVSATPTTEVENHSEEVTVNQVFHCAEGYMPDMLRPTGPIAMRCSGTCSPQSPCAVAVILQSSYLRGCGWHMIPPTSKSHLPRSFCDMDHCVSWQLTPGLCSPSFFHS